MKRVGDFGGANVAKFSRPQQSPKIHKNLKSTKNSPHPSYTRIMGIRTSWQIFKAVFSTLQPKNSSKESEHHSWTESNTDRTLAYELESVVVCHMRLVLATQSKVKFGAPVRATCGFN